MRPLLAIIRAALWPNASTAVYDAGTEFAIGRITMVANTGAIWTPQRTLDGVAVYIDAAAAVPKPKA